MKNEKERRIYELREKGRRDYVNAILASEQRGEMRGEMMGILKGKQEVARAMLADAMSPDLISKLTGLTVEEIRALR